MMDNNDLLIHYLPKVGIVIAVTMIVYVLIEPLLVGDRLKERKRALLAERDMIRNRERAMLAGSKSDNSLSSLLVAFANRAKLVLWLLDPKTQEMLVRAGYRTPSARGRFLAMRLLSVAGSAAAFVAYCVINQEYSWLPFAPFSAWIGYRFGIYFLEQTAKKRDAEMVASAPDIIDLLMICVEAGMSIELALQRVAQEIGTRSVVAGDELGVTAAELSYLSKRSDAFANLAQRTGAKTIQNLCMALIQADSFGASIVSTLRIQSAEARKLRQLEAERVALSIPPKLSVVMVLFFMPVIMIVMLYPSFTKMSDMKVGF